MLRVRKFRLQKKFIYLNQLNFKSIKNKSNKLIRTRYLPFYYVRKLQGTFLYNNKKEKIKMIAKIKSTIE